jgi:putative transposase
MLIPLVALFVSLRSLVRSRLDLQLENLTLHHQVSVLRRSARKRPKLTSGDRLFCVSLSRFWHDWRSALAIVKPETVVAWHRKGFRLFWTWKVRHGQPGRHVIARDTRSDPEDVPREF